MNWMKAVLAGAVGAVAVWLADFVMHGVIMANTYTKYPEVFTQEQANPFLFLWVGLFIAVAAAILFAKTRACWAEGVTGGATYGFFLGLVMFFPSFYNSLVFDGFPYFMSWCWGGIHLIDMVILGVVLGAIYKRA